MNDELIGALIICGLLSFFGLFVFGIGSDTDMRANTLRFWKWWAAFWFAPLAFNILRIVYIG